MTWQMDEIWDTGIIENIETQVVVILQVLLISKLKQNYGCMPNFKKNRKLKY